MTDGTRSTQAEALFEEWKVPFDLTDNFAIDQIQTQPYSQVRTEEHRAPKANVEQYALQMSNGAVFPPVVLAANDNAVIDGNTRIAAHRRIGRTTIPAYLIKPATATMARAIGAALNMMGGERLSPVEQEQAARDYLEAGFTDAEIARRLGRNTEWARRQRKEQAFNDRAADHPGAAKLNRMTKVHLADVGLDAPLTKVLDAVGDGLSVDSVWAKKIADATTGARSEAAAVQAVDQVLDEIRSVQQAPEARTAKAKQSRQMIQAMRKVDTLTKLLTELDVPLIDPMASDYRESLRLLRDAVDGVLGRLPAVPEIDAA
jgi:ParB-like chromosome segregation protein Spo0J